MKLIPLTQGKFTQVDDEDYDYLMQWKWYADKRNSTYYAKTTQMISGKKHYIFMHRVILDILNSKLHGDHKDRDGLNNQRSNLRIATRSQNAINRTKRLNTSSKYIGVIAYNNKWVARLRKNQKTIYQATFSNEKEAALAYNKEALKYYGEFANLNII